MTLPTQLIQNRELVLTGVFRYADTWPTAIALVEIRAGGSGRHGDGAIPTGEGRRSSGLRPDARQRQVGSAGVMKLNSSTLSRLPIDTPNYDRDEIGIGIVHFGVGGFHRAHQAMYIDRLLEKGLAQDWGICGVGVMPVDRRMREVLDAQNGLYTLILENPDGSRDARVIGSIVDYRYAPDDPESVIELLAAPTTRIISLTITEGGYNIDDPIAADRVNVFGLVAEALARRRDRGIASPTIVSCDNIEGNGDIARHAFTTYAERVHPGLGRLDGRQTPGFRIRWWTASPRSPRPTSSPALENEFGVEDQWPVVAEPFTSWVLEDDFSDGRPPLEEVGVLHGRRRDAVRADEAAAAQRQPPGPVLFRVSGRVPAGARCRGRPAVRRIPAAPTWIPKPRRRCKPVPGIDLPDYKRTLIERFANPGVRDTIARLCVGSSDRIPKWLLPVIRANLGTGAPIRLSAATVASWARYAEASTSRASRSRSSTSWPTRWCRSPSRSARIRTAFIENTAVFGDLAQRAAVRRGLPLGAGLAAPRRCAGDTGDTAAEGRRHESGARARAGHRRGADRHRRARRAGHRRARRRQPAERRRRPGAAGPRTSTSSPTSATTPRGRRITDYVESSGVQLVSGSVTADRTPTALATLDAGGSAQYTFDIDWQLSGTPEVAPPLVAHTGSIAAVLGARLPGHRSAAGRLPRVGDDHVRPECATGADRRR